ncbi:hypothetical protein [Sorangium sp. So ce1097]|uniref:hypothetical protein n=1 Tax=Sorangium sp. So ce1097 TaxID=3133330 RepID=UPI003F60BD19
MQAAGAKLCTPYLPLPVPSVRDPPRALHRGASRIALQTELARLVVEHEGQISPVAYLQAREHGAAARPPCVGPPAAHAPQPADERLPIGLAERRPRDVGAEIELLDLAYWCLGAGGGEVHGDRVGVVHGFRQGTRREERNRQIHDDGPLPDEDPAARTDRRERFPPPALPLDREALACEHDARPAAARLQLGAQQLLQRRGADAVGVKIVVR